MNRSSNMGHDNWHQPVSLFLPELITSDEEATLFDTRELLNGVVQPTGGSVPSINTTAAATTAPSPLSGANDASLSPSGGSSATTSGGVTNGPLSPGAISQTSNNAGSANGSMPVAAALGITDTDATPLGGTGVGSVPDAIADSGGGGVAGGGGGGTSCCENGRPIMTDPVSGQTVCSCQYDTARLALSSYSRMPAASVGVYGTPYPSTEQNPYPSIGVDSSAFYSPLSNPYALKEGNTGSDMTAWTSAGLQPTTGYYSYDPTLAAYGYGASYDLAARRKNATRESTATLKAWLNEHKKNPYPTKGEKIMLAIITKMTLTQVSTWFANARRRLKKENKMTWEPKNKTEDDDDAMLSDDEKEKDMHENEKVGPGSGVYGGMAGDPRKDVQSVKSEHIGKDDKPDDLNADDRKPENLAAMRNLAGPAGYNTPYGQHVAYNPYQQHHPAYYQQQQQPPPQQQPHGPADYAAHESSEYGIPKNPLGRGDCGIPIPASKPKIWSLADTVACKTPPPISSSYQQQQGQYYQQQQSPHPQQMLPTPPVGVPQMPLPQAAHNLSANAMSSYGGVSPYSRIPMAYMGAPNSSYNSNNSSSSNNSGSSGNSTGMPTTPTTPPTSMQAMQQQQQQQQQYYQQQQQQRMRFPEIQPDTPPQTPPNMKLAHAHNTSTVNPLRAGPAVTPTSGMCYTSGPPSGGAQLQHGAYGGEGACARFVARAEA